MTTTELSFLNIPGDDDEDDVKTDEDVGFEIGCASSSFISGICVEKVIELGKFKIW